MTCSTTAWSRCSASTIARSLGAVGEQREVPPVGPQLGLGAEQAGAPDDQPAAAVGGLGDLRLAARRGRRCAARRPRRSPATAAWTVLMFRTPIEYCQPDLLAGTQRPSCSRTRESALQQLLAGRAGTVDARDELLAEAQHPLLRVRRPLAQADVQHLAGVRAGGEDRVIPEQLGVAVGGALLQTAADLADEAVDIDDQPPVARARRRPATPAQAPGPAARRAGGHART